MIVINVLALNNAPQSALAGGATVCSSTTGGTTVTLLATISPSVAVTSYAWYSSTSLSTLGPGFSSPIAGANTSTYIAPTTTTGTVYYLVVESFNGTGCSPSTSNSETVIVTSPTWATSSVSPAPVTLFRNVPSVYRLQLMEVFPTP